MHVLEQEPELVEPVLRALEADVDKRIELLPSLQKGVGALALILPETSDLLATILAALGRPVSSSNSPKKSPSANSPRKSS